MGRPKTYDRQAIVTKAMDVFWLHGFEGSSTQMLTAHMGVNRFSLYAEFATKQLLFEAALAEYERLVVGATLAPLEAEGSGLAEITALFAHFGERAAGPGPRRGCLLCNTATERAPHDGASRVFVDDYLRRIAAAFAKALGHARAAGAIPSAIAIDDEARLLTTMLTGVFVLMRAQAETPVIEGACRAAQRHVERLRVARD